ncbi:MAG: hypothetical protein ACPLW9_02375, partial [Minisyncoccales bacterium]
TPYLYYQISTSYYSWQIGRAAKQFEQDYLNFLKQDTYGGKTPQETYELYVDALKKGDIDLAVRYYYWEKQEQEKERLMKLKEQGKFEDYVNSLPKWEEMKEEEYWNPEMKMYNWEKFSEEEKVYDPLINKEIIFPAGIYEASLIFWFNQHAGIWKLY